MTAVTEEPEFEQLPVLYQRWVQELLPAGIPREREATCFNCAMCSHGQPPPAGGMGFFHPVTKCCTYFPELPNFLAGRAATAEGPGAAVLRAFIEDENQRQANVTLRAVQPNAKIVTVYAHHRDEAFGRDPDMLCPYAVTTDPEVGPLCGIWRHRNSVCSTWFCKHTRGATGFQFWHMLQAFLSSLEWPLSWWAITEIIPDPASVVAIAEAQLPERNKVGLCEDAWRHWPGTRLSFYEACAERVESLSVHEALDIAGMEARLQRIELDTRFDELIDPEAPERLRTAMYTVIAQDERHAVLKSARFPQTFEAPVLLLSVLHYFDGRPTAEVLEHIRQDTRIRLDPGIVRRLYDFGILARVSEAPRDASGV